MTWRFVVLLTALFFSSPASGAVEYALKCFSPLEAAQPNGDGPFCDKVEQYPAAGPPDSYNYSYQTMNCTEGEYVEFFWETPWWAEPNNGSCTDNDPSCDWQFNIDSTITVVTEESNTNPYTWKIEARAVKINQAVGDITWGGAAELTMSADSVFGAGDVALTQIQGAASTPLKIYDADGTVCRTATNNCATSTLIIRITRGPKLTGPTVLGLANLCIAPPE